MLQSSKWKAKSIRLAHRSKISHSVVIFGPAHLPGHFHKMRNFKGTLTLQGCLVCKTWHL